ncbi:SDR family NAD(P)-dependent oxidoreductase [Aquimarina sp. MMG016]|uniref:SDR family NAD(P)-dependent oxidoreductase n=1 Tax=Aquimarina sp. MMG016 TaxID=2822690 RepID=UPI001B39FABE|nr:SDR family NAD(P)-dependent oxidoreductase [Aquimarina sp. MMG016]MBQ4818994.1 SDR family NAD(P)-dependent oxidoreductase [Aquimarina sp. MMG016]
MAIGKTVLVTGGSSGIGFSISKHFANAGYQLLWVSLVKEEIDIAISKLRSEIPDCNIDSLVLDLSSSDSAVKVYNWVKENQWNVDVLINNAGFGTFGFSSDIDIDRELNMIELNVVNVYKMTRLFLKDMLHKDEGTIINISSNTSFQPTPKLSAYGATKSFVNHFSRSVNEELKILKSNVKIMCVCPAAIKNTNFRKAGKMDKLKTFSGLATTTSEEVAKDVWNGFIKHKDFVVSGWKMRILYRISGLVPYGIQQFLVRKEIKEVQ